MKDLQGQEVPDAAAPVLPEGPFADISSGLPLGLYVLRAGKFRSVNAEFERITGFKDHELLGSELLSLVPVTDRGMVEARVMQVAAGERTPAFEHRLATREGKTRRVLHVASSTAAGEGEILGGLVDVSHLYRTQESLRHTEDRFYAVFRYSPDWAVITALEDGFYVDVNETFLRKTGYRREEVIGRTSTQLGIWADPGHRAELVSTLHAEGAVIDREVRFRMKSGKVRHMLWSADVIDFGGEKCLIAVAHDITERKRAEQSRLLHAAQLGPATLVTQLGLSMVGSILLCFALGYYLDRWFDTGGLFIALFIVLGVLGGGYNAYRQIMENIKVDEKADTQDRRPGSE